MPVSAADDVTIGRTLQQVFERPLQGRVSEREREMQSMVRLMHWSLSPCSESTPSSLF